MANYETILIDRQDNIATITFNRPNKRNAMNPMLHQEMVDVLSGIVFEEEHHHKLSSAAQLQPKESSPRRR